MRSGNATWSGRSESRGRNARTAAGRPRARPVYSSGAPPGPGMIARAHAGASASAPTRCGAGEVDVAEDGLVGLEDTDPRAIERAADIGEVGIDAVGAMASDGLRRELRRQRALEDDQVEQLGCVSGPYLVGGDAVQLAVGQVRQRGLEIRVAVADEEDPAQPVGRHDRPGTVVEPEVVTRDAGIRVGDAGGTRRTSMTRTPAAGRRSRRRSASAGRGTGRATP